jgi:DNA mismatch repair protein MutS
MKKIVETPLMKQYLEMKRKHPDAILLFRVGDFYETFSDDAIEASQILGITLTRRANGAATHVELAGFPHHALDSYLPKLVRAGKRVAICEQLEDPKLTKKLVKRGITELVTPGINMSDNILQAGQNNYLAGLSFGTKSIGVAFLDISTGEFLCEEGDKASIDKLLSTIQPKEVVMMRGEKGRAVQMFPLKCAMFELEDWIYTYQAANDRLTRQFSTSTLKGFGLEHMPQAVVAAGSLIYYLDSTNHTHTSHITSLRRIDQQNYVRLDRFTLRNLEVLTPLTEEGTTLLQIIDRTCSPIGARRLRKRLMFPLLDHKEINHRLDVVEWMVGHPEESEQMREYLTDIGDPERIAARTAALRVGPRELVRLRHSLQAFVNLKRVLLETDSQVMKAIGESLDPLTELTDTLQRTLLEDSPLQASQGGMIASGVNAELDELRGLLHHNKEALNAILAREIEATGIPSLKISFNNVFGYYIEVRNTHRDKVPETWIRKQTLVSAERYITPELKEFEQKILGAEERISILETQIFNKLVEDTGRYVPTIMHNANEAAEIDCHLAMAAIADDYGYVRPQVDDSLELDITEGRHPVIERMMPVGEQYVSNSVHIDCDNQQILIITGPNMSGKSALLRQTALIVLLAQTGSFVPARAAKIGVVDKIFTRVGAGDNISRGESTFMTEMTEAAAILNNMSPRSLILFDELGRGTATYDGISIAWAIVEHIHENGYCRPKTLFATHYHELNEMEKSFPRIANFNVSVSEVDGKVVFMRKLRKGGSEHSFGIHVAKIAGIPPSIVKRANQVLARLEEDNASGGGKAELKDLGKMREGYQMSIFQLDDPLVSEIRGKILKLDIDNLTPLQALTILHDLKSLLLGREA